MPLHTANSEVLSLFMTSEPLYSSELGLLGEPLSLQLPVSIKSRAN